MCRMVVFAGTCTSCSTFYTWNELSQELSCLEAKNNGIFGECRRGIQLEEHIFNQECEACAEEANNDEGVAGLDDDDHLAVIHAGKSSSSSSSSSGKSSKSHSHHHHSSSLKTDSSRKKKKQRN